MTQGDLLIFSIQVSMATGTLNIPTDYGYPVKLIRENDDSLSNMVMQSLCLWVTEHVEFQVDKSTYESRSLLLYCIHPFNITDSVYTERYMGLPVASDNLKNYEVRHYLISFHIV